MTEKEIALAEKLLIAHYDKLIAMNLVQPSQMAVNMCISTAIQFYKVVDLKKEVESQYNAAESILNQKQLNEDVKFNWGLK